MEQVKNVRYGIMNSDYEKNVIKKMGVKEDCIYHFSQGTNLIQKMQLGDSVYVATVKSFAISAYDLVQKLQYLSNRGIDFASSNERYLNFSAIHSLPDTTVELIRNIAQREYEFVAWVQKTQLSRDAKAKLISRIQWESLTDISMIFRSNGIKKRGN